MANADKVMAIETRLAKASKSSVELRDPYANYNKMSGDGIPETDAEPEHNYLVNAT